MTVYVDDMKAQFGRMVMCHMLADTDEELLAMADRIGVQRKWHQYPGTHRSHFDIALSKRAEAVAAGAVEIRWRDAGRVTNHRRKVALGKAEPLSIVEILTIEAYPDGVMVEGDGVPPHPPSRHCGCAECAAYFNGEPCTRGVLPSSNDQQEK